MGMIVDPEFDKSMHEMVPVCKGMLDEVIEYFDKGEFVKAQACFAMVYFGIEPMMRTLQDYYSVAEYESLRVSGWEPQARVKWKEENKELWEEIKKNKKEREAMIADRRQQLLEALIRRYNA